MFEHVCLMACLSLVGEAAAERYLSELRPVWRAAWDDNRSLTVEYSVTERNLVANTFKSWQAVLKLTRDDAGGEAGWLELTPWPAGSGPALRYVLVDGRLHELSEAQVVVRVTRPAPTGDPGLADVGWDGVRGHLRRYVFPPLSLLAASHDHHRRLAHPAGRLTCSPKPGPRGMRVSDP